MLLTSWPKPSASHGALQAGQNKLILDEEIPKLDQPMSDRGASTHGVDMINMGMWISVDNKMNEWVSELMTAAVIQHY